jgi:hypothetical protein
MSDVRDRFSFEISGSHDIDLWDEMPCRLPVSYQPFGEECYPEDGSSETLVTTYQTTQPHTLKDSNLHKKYFSTSG